MDVQVHPSDQAPTVVKCVIRSRSLDLPDVLAKIKV